MFGKRDDDQQDDLIQADQMQSSGLTDTSQAGPTPDATLEDSPSDDTAAPSSASPPPELPGQFGSTKTLPPPSSSGPATAVASDDLINLKQEALQQLSPLISHLDQTPEERFRTTMMMIQATDDSSKIQDAYDAAKQITDDKARAQALLDIVNEINYFTQHNKEK